MMWQDPVQVGGSRVNEAVQWAMDRHWWYYPLVFLIILIVVFGINQMAKRWLEDNEGFDLSCKYRDITNRNLKL